ncbi:MAG: hypothetical protein M1828_006448 [Chrysothrix sp. TS-e1954]|nr:MAG: hypothetical protein M1828_006448 [Chrysothrix sp. TS-e1954]
MIAFPGVKDCSQRTLELWLMQHFTLYTRDNFTPSVVETWVSGHKHLFFEHEFLLDSCLALSALHLSRLHPEKRYTEASNFYFGKAVEAHRSAIVQLHPGNAAAALLTSCQILAHALASTGEDMGARDEWPSKVDPTSWLQLAGQSRHIFRECRHAAGDDGDLFRLQQDVEPVMRNFDPSSKPPHRERFLFLLSHGSEYEVPTSKDKDAYERTLSLIGLIYENAGNESAIATCRRIWSTPARSPWRFIELAEEKRPRALAILAYLYASIKLIKTELWWFQGVAEKQVIRISNLLPLSWKSLIKEPLQMIGAEDGIQ